MREHALKRVAVATLALLGASGAAFAQQVAQTIEIVGTAPLPGQGVDRSLLPYTTQLLRRTQVDEAQADTTTDLLARRVPGVQVNDIQGSPFQGDLTFRGFRASGILGASQGLSVYLDGVRINEPFGDVVNWDLVPEFALDSISLVPGANPAFGLNTLGGAIALTTASGRSAPGVRSEASLGSFGRKRAGVSVGAAGDDWHAYAALGLFDENGWRDFSAGNLGTLLAKAGRRTEAGEFTLSVLAGRGRLVGNNLVPLVTLDDNGTRTPDIGSARRAAVYTHPDLTRNRVAQAGLGWRHELGGNTLAEALAYLRRTGRTTVNGDVAAEVGQPATPTHLSTAPPRARRPPAWRSRCPAASARTSGRRVRAWTMRGCATSRPSRRAPSTPRAACCRSTASRPRRAPTCAGAAPRPASTPPTPGRSPRARI